MDEEKKIKEVIEMGVPENLARHALSLFGWNVQRVVNAYLGGEFKDYMGDETPVGTSASAVHPIDRAIALSLEERNNEERLPPRRPPTPPVQSDRNNEEDELPLDHVPPNEEAGLQGEGGNNNEGDGIPRVVPIANDQQNNNDIEDDPNILEIQRLRAMDEFNNLLEFVRGLPEELRYDGLRQLLIDRADLVNQLPEEMLEEIGRDLAYLGYETEEEEEEEEEEEGEKEEELSEEDKRGKRWLESEEEEKKVKTTKLRGEEDLVSIIRLLYFKNIMNDDEVQRILKHDISIPQSRLLIFRYLFAVLSHRVFHGKNEVISISESTKRNIFFNGIGEEDLEELKKQEQWEKSKKKEPKTEETEGEEEEEVLSVVYRIPNHVREKIIHLLWSLSEDNYEFTRLFLSADETNGIRKNPILSLLKIYSHYTTTDYIRVYITKLITNVLFLLKIDETKRYYEELSQNPVELEKFNEQKLKHVEEICDPLIDHILKIWYSKDEIYGHKDRNVEFLLEITELGVVFRRIVSKEKILRKIANDVKLNASYIITKKKNKFEDVVCSSWKDLDESAVYNFKNSLDLLCNVVSLFNPKKPKEEKQKKKEKEEEEKKKEEVEGEEEEEEDLTKSIIFKKVIEDEEEEEEERITNFIEKDDLNYLWIVLESILSTKKKGEFKEEVENNNNELIILSKLIACFIKYNSLFYGLYNNKSTQKKNILSLSTTSSSGSLFSSLDSSSNSGGVFSSSFVGGGSELNSSFSLIPGKDIKIGSVQLLSNEKKSKNNYVSSKKTPLSQSFRISISTPERRIEKFLDDHTDMINDLIFMNQDFLKKWNPENSKSKYYERDTGLFRFLLRSKRLSMYLSFENKRSWLGNQLHKKHQETYGEINEIKIRRTHIYDDAYFQIGFLRKKELHELKHDLRINFKDEVAQDMGGPKREFFLELSRQVINPGYGIFTMMGNQSTYQPNQNSLSIAGENHLKLFRFVGIVIGMAIYHEQLIDCYFTRSFYKHILGRRIVYSDVESIDHGVYTSLKWLVEHNDPELLKDYGFKFTVMEKVFGEGKDVDLKPNGSNILVTQENKYEYIRLMTNYKMVKGIEEQLKAFLEGFYSMIPKKMISIFSENELELLMSGCKEFDVEDLRKNTVYKSEHYKDEKECEIIHNWFWNWVEGLTKDEKSLFLQFVTGTSKIPVGGFKNLMGQNGHCLFSIHRIHIEKFQPKLPHSHTCFNQLDLPHYHSEEQLRKSLYFAIKNTVGFGFA